MLAPFIHRDITNSLELKTYGDWGAFRKIFERKLIEVPNTLRGDIVIRKPNTIRYDFGSERYYAFAPTYEIHEYILDKSRSETSTRINTCIDIVTITLPKSYKTHV